jgi:DNA-binding Lrp family transcriptional regulator
MLYEQIKPLLIDYLIQMTGCPVSPSQIAQHMNMSHNTIRRYLKKLVDYGEVDRVDRIVIPNNRIILTGQMYYVNNLMMVTNNNARYHIKQYQHFKEYCGDCKVYYEVKELYIKRKGLSKHYMFNVGLCRIKTQ